jgi:hypothetical protein
MTGKSSRYYKTQMHRLSPFPGITLFMDDDTIMHRPLPELGSVIAECDIAAKLEPGCATVGQTCQAGKHSWICAEEKEYTGKHFPADVPHYNSGVVVFRKSESVYRLFDRWHEEWMQFQNIDQLALSRALTFVPTSIAKLDESWNYRSERKGRDAANPYIFHCHRKQDNDNWYHANYHRPAAPHAKYLAFCEAVNNGQWARGQYETAGRLVGNLAPLNLLIWGCGHDSNLWRALNHGGRTVFVETDSQWAKRARQSGCEVIEWQPPTSRGAPFQGDMPDCPAGGKWDMIIVDGPPGHAIDTPGRELPIAWAATMGAKIILLHDIERPWERHCADRYLGPPTCTASGNGILGVWECGYISPGLLSQIIAG